MTASMLDRAAAWLDAQRKAHLSLDATYTRGSVSLSASVTIGKTESQVGSDDASSILSECRDIILSAADLGALVEPAPGDRITIGTVIYEALELGHMGCWRYCDGGNVMMRIHVRAVDLAQS
jgi:hypothetical protein